MTFDLLSANLLERKINVLYKFLIRWISVLAEVLGFGDFFSVCLFVFKVWNLHNSVEAR